MVISSALGSSPRLPVLVYGTGTARTRIEAFLGSVESVNPHSPKGPRPPIPQGYDTPDLPGASPYSEGPARPIAGRPILLRPPIAQTSVQWCRNINLLSIDYAFLPRLRTRLTLGGLPLPRKP